MSDKPTAAVAAAESPQASSQRGAWSRLNINERLTAVLAAGSLLVGISSVAVSFLAWRTASDSSDIKAAISNLSNLATQTKRQADATHDQLGAMRDQVGLLKEQVGETKHQTRAISQQTAAMKATSEANMRAAQAQQRMADTTAKAQLPGVALQELSVRELSAKPSADGMVHFKLFWRFRNTGGSALTVKQISYGLIDGPALPDKMPDGLRFPGQGVVVTPTITSAFAPAEPLEMWMPTSRRDPILSGTRKLFFFARFEFEDTLGVEHVRCFGREFIIKGAGSDFAIPSGGPAYDCGR